MLSLIDYIIIVLYFVGLLSVGFIASRKAKTKEDYLVAGRSLPLPLFTACMAAVVIGGGATLGGTELAYKSGISGIWLGGMYAISIFLLAWLLNTKMSNMRILSTNEGVGIFYGPQARLVSALVTLIYLFMIAVLQIVGIGTILHTMLGWSSQVSMIVGGVIIVAYLILGGMWAVAFTDIIRYSCNRHLLICRESQPGKHEYGIRHRCSNLCAHRLKRTHSGGGPGSDHVNG